MFICVDSSSSCKGAQAGRGGKPSGSTWEARGLFYLRVVQYHILWLPHTKHCSSRLLHFLLRKRPYWTSGGNLFLTDSPLEKTEIVWNVKQWLILADFRQSTRRWGSFPIPFCPYGSFSQNIKIAHSQTHVLEYLFLKNYKAPVVA